MYQSATIFALSSGAAPSGVAIIRVSGPAAMESVRLLCGFVPDDRTAALTDFRFQDELLDRGLVLVFSSPASFTGEDCAEFHTHGGRATVAAMLGALGALPGLRPAEAGEFTRQAFVNGKMDLTGVEALGDLISAETDMQRRFALASAKQSELYGGWREQIVHGRAMIEAELDFSDEGDVPGSVADAVWRDIAALSEEMNRHLDGARTGEVLREGFQVVILGAPNAGKSSLLNSLANRDAAIVSDEPGTTRDLVEVVLDLDGIRTIVTDTAGLRERPERVEAMGIERALQRAQAADLVLLVEDMSDPVPVIAPEGRVVVRVGAKCDLESHLVAGGGYDLKVSSLSGAGIEDVIDLIRRVAAERIGGWSMSAIPSQLRHVGLVRSARDSLKLAQDARVSLELRAEALRLAGDDLGRIVGKIETEEVLGAIFSRFCIGK
jgi:tRNA modification GTPase